MGYVVGKQVKDYLESIVKTMLEMIHIHDWQCIIDFSGIFWRIFTGTVAYINDDMEEESVVKSNDESVVVEEKPVPSCINISLLHKLVDDLQEKIYSIFGSIKIDEIQVVLDSGNSIVPKNNRVSKKVMSKENFVKLKAMENITVDFVRSIVVFDEKTVQHFLQELHPSLVGFHEVWRPWKRAALREHFELDEDSDVWSKLLRPCGYLSEKKLNTIRDRDSLTPAELAEFMSPEGEPQEDGTVVITNKQVWSRLVKHSKFRSLILHRISRIYVNHIVNHSFKPNINFSIDQSFRTVVELHGYKRKYRVNYTGVSKLPFFQIVEADTTIGFFMRGSSCNILVLSPDGDMIFQAFRHEHDYGDRHVYWMPKLNENKFYDLASPSLSVEKRYRIMLSAALLGTDFIYTKVGGNFVKILAAMEAALTIEQKDIRTLMSNEVEFGVFLDKFVEANASSRKGKRHLNGELVPFSTSEEIRQVLLHC